MTRIINIIFSQLMIMKTVNEKRKIIIEAKKNGFEKTSKKYNISSRIIRIWYSKLTEFGIEGLSPKSREKQYHPKKMDDIILNKILLYKKKYPKASANLIKKELNLNFSTVTIYKKLNEKLLKKSFKKKYLIKSKNPKKENEIFIYSVKKLNINKMPENKNELFRYELLDFHSDFIYYYISKDKNLMTSARIIEHFFSKIINRSLSSRKIEIITNKSPEFYSKNSSNNHIHNVIAKKFNLTHKIITPYHKNKMLSNTSKNKIRYIHKTSTNDNEFIDIYISLADLFANKNKFESAKEIYSLGYKIARDDNKSYDIIRLLLRFGNLNLNMGNFDEAEKYYSETITKSKNIKNTKHFLVRSKGNLALIKMIKNDYNSAEIGFIEVLNLSRKHKLKTLETHALGNLAIVYDSKNDIKKSLSYYIKVLWRYKSNNDLNNFAVTLGNIALILKRMGSHSRSEKFFKMQINISKKINDISALGLAYGNLSLLYVDKQEIKDAIKYNSLSISTLRNANNNYYLCTSYIEKTKLLITEEKYDLAVESLEKGFLLNNKINNTDYRVEIEILKSIILIRKNIEKKKSDIKFVKSILKLFKEIEKLRNLKILKTDKRYRRTYNLYIISKYLYEQLLYIEVKSNSKLKEKIFKVKNIEKYKSDFLKYQEIVLGIKDENK